MSCNQTVSASNVFIDLATFSEQEGFVYGGPSAITWFVRGVQKSNWFSFIPILLRSDNTLNFDQRNSSVSVNRSGDYVLNVWFRAKFPRIKLQNNPCFPGTNGNDGIAPCIAWTHNLMHNLFSLISISFNELVVEEFDNYWLDIYANFTLPQSKWVGYQNMIGNVPSMTEPQGPGSILGTGEFRNLPLPLWFSEDSGVALPVAALPFNDIKINFNIRDWKELIILFPGCHGPNDVASNPMCVSGDLVCAGFCDICVVSDDACDDDDGCCSCASGTANNGQVTLINPQVWAHYAVVHNDERVKMGAAPRDILIQQVQFASEQDFKGCCSPCSSAQNLRSTNGVSECFDLRLSHSIISIFWMAQNISLLTRKRDGGGDWSNYTTLPSLLVTGDPDNPNVIVKREDEFLSGFDPIQGTCLLYENTNRVAMESDYFSLVAPYYFAPRIPDTTGYHMYSYSLHPFEYRVAGSTNYSKLANVSICHTLSSAAIQACNCEIPCCDDKILWSDCSCICSCFPQRFRHILRALNWNIGRVANGSFGHPTL